MGKKRKSEYLTGGASGGSGGVELDRSYIYPHEPVQQNPHGKTVGRLQGQKNKYNAPGQVKKRPEPTFRYMQDAPRADYRKGV